MSNVSGFDFESPSSFHGVLARRLGTQHSRLWSLHFRPSHFVLVDQHASGLGAIISFVGLAFWIANVHIGVGISLFDTYRVAHGVSMFSLFFYRLVAGHGPGIALL